MTPNNAIPVEIRHGLSVKDAGTVAAISAHAAPFKGAMFGPAARGGYDTMIESFPDSGEVIYEDGEVGGVRGVWCQPKTNVRKDAAILYLHGGGYVLGSARAYRHFAGRFAAKVGATTFIPDYGLAPERPFPAAPDDALAVYRGLVEKGFHKIALVGDSAGGGLALVLLALTQAAAAVGEGLAPVGAVVTSPWTDLALTGDSVVTKAVEDPLLTPEVLRAGAASYLGAEPPRNPRASPLFGALSGLPPVQVHVGTAEVLLDDSLRYGERAHEAGVEASVHVWEGMPHVFTSNIGTLEAADEALGIMFAFIKDKLET